MRVAIIGSGGIGRGYAAFLTEQGHEPVIWSPSGAAAAEFGDDLLLTATGKLDVSVPIRLAPDCAAALDGSGVVIVAVQANGFRAVFDAVASHLTAGQTVIISAHCSFAALYLRGLLTARGLDIPVVAWSTTALTARKTGPRSVNISGIRAKLDAAILPTARAPEGLAACQAVFGDRFTLRDDLLAVMLSNLNPLAHMANMLGNLTRAERGEDWPNYGSITHGVGRIMAGMDVERLALAKAFGLSMRSVQEHWVAGFGVAPGTLGDMAAEIYEKRPELMGPKTLDTRYITEDVPFGLVPLEMLGAIAGVPLPLHQAGIALFDAICARDFRAENDLLPALALDGLDRDGLLLRLRAA